MREQCQLLALGSTELDVWTLWTLPFLGPVHVVIASSVKRLYNLQTQSDRLQRGALLYSPLPLQLLLGSRGSSASFVLFHFYNFPDGHYH